MRWYNHLYVGDKAEKKRYQIISGVRHPGLFSTGYVITPALNGNNILDIYPSFELRHEYYRDKELLVIGIAADYQEALLVAAEIVNAMYKNTGGFNLQEFLEKEQ